MNDIGMYRREPPMGQTAPLALEDMEEHAAGTPQPTEAAMPQGVEDRRRGAHGGAFHGVTLTPIAGAENRPCTAGVRRSGLDGS